MRTFPFRVNGEQTTTTLVETDEDYVDFEAWLAETPGVLALDTETTGLNIHAADFRCRLLQVGTATAAWVVPIEAFHSRLRGTLERQHTAGRRYVAHNAPYDLLVLDRVGLAPLTALLPRVYDTYILAHLIDPRGPADGGVGLSLKALSTLYVDPEAADTAKGLYEVFRSEYKATKATGWALIDVSHPLYVTYAGLDVIYTSRLLAVLGGLVRAMRLTDLATFEHQVQALTTRLQHRGLRIDVDYTTALVDDLAREAEVQRGRAAAFDVTSVNAPKQVAAGLLALGEVWTERTESGAPQVSKEVLARFADIDVRSWTRKEVREPNPLADAVIRAKRAVKWSASYAVPFLRDRDGHDRIHPGINSLAARTARMSVSTPPLQQLPSGDWRIRRAIVADPGHTIVAADYKAVELRVLAALGNVAAMRLAIREGRDLHDFTAGLIYGEGFTKDQRRIAKTVGLGKVYGGGAASLAEQAGAPLEQVQVAVARYESVYPEVRAYSNQLQYAARTNGGKVITPLGRQIPVDEHRGYAAINYQCQSTARDILAKALVAADEAGMFDYLLLPVHDELVCQAPTADAPEVIAEVGRLMQRTLMGVAIDSDTEVYGPSWGHGYGCKVKDGVCTTAGDHPHKVGVPHT